MKDFSLKEIVYSGQVFRWEEEGDHFRGIVNGKVYRIKEGEEIVDPYLLSYFDFDTDYNKIKEVLCCDEVMKKAISSCPGMRIVRQELWETILSFIISQNNNIPRIKTLIDRISKAYGEEIEEGIYDIPSPSVLAKLDNKDLLDLKFGYRGEYIIESSKKYIRLGLDKEKDPIAKLKEYARNSNMTNTEFLMTFKGIGPKVANCISLFSLHEIEAFPIDTWVKKVMHRLYDIPINNTKEMEAFAKENFKEYSGIAQQYLFYYIRKLNEIF